MRGPLSTRKKHNFSRYQSRFSLRAINGPSKPRCLSVSFLSFFLCQVFCLQSPNIFKSGRKQALRQKEYQGQAETLMCE